MKGGGWLRVEAKAARVFVHFFSFSERNMLILPFSSRVNNLLVLRT